MVLDGPVDGIDDTPRVNMVATSHQQCRMSAVCFLLVMLWPCDALCTELEFVAHLL